MTSLKSFFKPLESSAGGANYFAQVNQKSKEHETMDQNASDQTLGQERLSVLHSRLQQEAENIRKWKTRTEMDMKQKDKKLIEATQTVDALRKSMLELQLQNESLSLKLQEELGNREEIVSRINSTRDMCTLLKDYVTNVEDRIQKCETEKTEVKYMEKEHVKDLEELAGKFKSLSVSAEREKEKFQNQLDSIESQKNRNDTEHKQALEDSQAELASLNAECEEKSSVIAVMKQSVDTKQKMIDQLKQQNDELLLKINITGEEIEGKETLLVEKQEELAELKRKHEEVSHRLGEITEKWEEVTLCKDKLSSNFDATEQLYVDKIKNLQDELHRVQESLEAQQIRVQELEGKLIKSQNSVEDLKCVKDMLTLERTEATKMIKELELSHENMTKKQEELECQLNCTTSEKEELCTNLMNLRDELTVNEEQVVSLRAHIVSTEADISRLTSKLQVAESHSEELQDALSKAMEHERESFSQLDKLQSELANESDEKDDLSDKLAALTSEKQNMEKTLEKKEKENQKLKHDLETASLTESELREKISSDDQRLKDIQEQLQVKEAASKEGMSVTEAKFRDEYEKRIQLEKKLDSSNKKLADVETKLKKSKEDLSAKTKQAKEAEKELKSSRAMLTAQSKTSGNLVDAKQELQEQLDRAMEQQKELNTEAEKLRQTLQAKTSDADEAFNKITVLEAAAKKAVDEKEAAKMQCDSQIQEMTRAVDNYKEWYDKLVATKDKELEEATKKEQEADKQVKDLTAKLEDLEKELQTVVSDKAESDKQTKEFASERKTLEKSLAQKQKEIDALNKKLDKADSKVEQSKSHAKEIKQKTKEIESLKSDLKAEREKLDKLHKELSSFQDGLKDVVDPTATTSYSLDVIHEDSEMSTVADEHRPSSPQAAMTPRTPVVRRTPKASKNVMSLNTPKMQIAASKSDLAGPLMKTPSGILKQSNTNEDLAIKRRKVAFAANEDSESVCSEASSTSDFMEVEIDEEGGATLKSNLGSLTPLMVKPSSIPKRTSYTPQRKNIPSSAQPLTPVNRTPVYKTPENPILREKEQHQQLYKEGAKSMIPKAKVDIRKAPAKNPGKFFKSSPLERQKQKMRGGSLKQEKVQDISWFDMDATFGFGPED